MPLFSPPLMGLEWIVLLGGVFRLFRRTDAAHSQPETETAPYGEPHPTVEDAEDRDENLRILVAEDNPVNRWVMELMLKRMGYAADIAVDGRQAVEMATSKAYDAILMDLHMPRMGGIEATEVIIGRLPKPVPRVVAVTADVTQEAREACTRVGMSAYLTKPLDSARLLHELKQAEADRESLEMRRTG